MRTRAVLLLIAAAALLISASAANARVELKSFLSPSGNIACQLDMLSPAEARCDIKAHTFKAHARNCQLDSGDSVYVDARGPGGLTCHGDTAFGQYPRLAYGHSETLGAFTCHSATSGVTCENTATGHGFFISKEKYRLF